ncbi:MAG: hypothetical protein QG675_445 [Patescibacteria group bacterium]|jgi:hypothetical protein|nr:hypothetical protein [Patescibacteria group bacterium]
MSFETEETSKRLRDQLADRRLECEGLEYAGNFAATIRNTCFIVAIVLFLISTVMWIFAFRISTGDDRGFWCFIFSIVTFGASLSGLGLSLFSHRKLVRFENSQERACNEIMLLEAELFLIDTVSE